MGSQVEGVCGIVNKALEKSENPNKLLPEVAERRERQRNERDSMAKSQGRRWEMLVRHRF